MAHAHALPFPAHARESLDATRIAANAGTILVNAALILLLLVPLTERIAAPAPKLDDAITLFDIPPKKDPPKRQEVEIVREPPKPSATPTPRPQPQVVAVEQPVVDAQPGDIAIEPAVVTGETSTTLDPPPSPTGAQLQALQSPPPPYPGPAMREGLRGVVELEILVGIDGRPVEVRVVRSSGHRVLDQAALRTVRTKWVFQPAIRNGQPVQALGRVPIEFTLE